MEIETEVGFQLLDRFGEEAVGLTDLNRLEGPDPVPAHDRAVPLDDSVVTVEEGLGIVRSDGVAAVVVGEGGRGQLTSSGATGLGFADKRECVGVRERRRLEAGSVHAEGVAAICAAAANSHGGVKAGVVQAVPVVDDEQVEKSMVITEEVDDNLAGLRIQGIVDEVGNSDLESVPLVSEGFGIPGVRRETLAATGGDVVVPVGTRLVRHGSRRGDQAGAERTESAQKATESVMDRYDRTSVILAKGSDPE